MWPGEGWKCHPGVGTGEHGPPAPRVFPGGNLRVGRSGVRVHTLKWRDRKGSGQVEVFASGGGGVGSVAREGLVPGQRSQDWGRVRPLGSRVGGQSRGHLEQHEELEEPAECGREEPRVGDSHLEEERVKEAVAHVDERVGVEVGGARPARGGRASAATVGPGRRGPGSRVLRHAAQRRALPARGSPRAPPSRHQPSTAAAAAAALLTAARPPPPPPAPSSASAAAGASESVRRPERPLSPRRTLGCRRAARRGPAPRRGTGCV